MNVVPGGRRWLVHPYPALVGVVFVLSIVQASEISIAAAARPILLAIGLGIGLAGLGRLLAGDRDRGAMLGLLAVVAIVRGADGRFLVLPGAAVVLLVAEAWLSRRRGRSVLPWPAVSRVGNVVSGLVVAVLLAQVATAGALGPEPRRDPAWGTASAGDVASRPDIHLLLLDGHGRLDVLEAAFGLDSSAFEAGLDELGFRIAPASRANYMTTRFTLASMLNGGHLADLGVDPATADDDPRIDRALHDSAALRLVSRAGYETISISGGWEQTALRGVDDFRDVGRINELENSVVYNGLLADLAFALDPDFTGSEIRERFERNLATLVALAREPRSADAPARFVFAHFPMPHMPEVYQADCRPRPVGRRALAGLDAGASALGSGAAPAALVARQAAQTACVDRLVLEALAAIVAADPDAVVIVFSDHGPSTLFSFAEPEEPGIVTRLGNLFAARTPGHPDLFPDDITLVNVLPTLFDAYLGTALPRRADDVFVGPDPATGGVRRLEP
jgi:hypothetical protein